MEIADKIDKKPAYNIDLAKGKLPFKGKGLSNSVNIATCTLEEQRRHAVSYTHLTLPTKG